MQPAKEENICTQTHMQDTKNYKKGRGFDLDEHHMNIMVKKLSKG